MEKNWTVREVEAPRGKGKQAHHVAPKAFMGIPVDTISQLQKMKAEPEKYESVIKIMQHMEQMKDKANFIGMDEYLGKGAEQTAATQTAKATQKVEEVEMA